ncbi:MAG: glutathione peroxidase [Pseudomonadota bacterium]
MVAVTVAMPAGIGRAAGAESAHGFHFPALEGGAIRLSAYAGRSVLVVNTASFCGFTPQYAALQDLSDSMEGDLVVLGVPSDSFNQEADNAEDVKAFCEVNYGITFPLTDILPVRGPSAHPFYRWAAQHGAVPRWNFHKILLGPDGRFVADFATRTRPGDRRLREAILDSLPG